MLVARESYSEWKALLYDFASKSQIAQAIAPVDGIDEKVCVVCVPKQIPDLFGTHVIHLQNAQKNYNHCQCDQYRKEGFAMHSWSGLPDIAGAAASDAEILR